MSNWKVFKTKIEVFVHPNADALMLGKVGSYQVVIQKVFTKQVMLLSAPEKSVLTGDIKKCIRTMQDLNMIEKSIRLRGEICIIT
jgi:hypothetical protein